MQHTILIRNNSNEITDIRKMSVHEVADKTVETLETGKYPFVILNLANPDMVAVQRFVAYHRLDILVFMPLLSRL